MPVIKMDFEMMGKMVNSCHVVEEELEEVKHEIQQIEELLNGGGLLGDGGTALVQALQEALVPQIECMRAKFEELQRDLREAVHAMGGADQDVAKEVGTN